MRCHLLNGEFIDRDVQFDEVVNVTRANWKVLRGMSVQDIVALLDRLGREIVKDPSCRSLDGISYISMWLRRSNLERMMRTDYGDIGALDGFVRSEGMMLRAQPRGVACHWVANNVTTLGAFSVLLAILSKNASLVKASTVNKGHILTILRKLSSVRFEVDGRTLDGMDIVKAVAVMTFEGKDTASSSAFSEAADIKVVWGGADSVAAITALPTKASCETVVFGPKYSLAVMDRDFSAAPDLSKRLVPFAQDVVLFDQMACSSPQVLFVEEGGVPRDELVKALAVAFGSVRESSPESMPEDLCAKVINARGRYLLDTEKGMTGSTDLSWTILTDDEKVFPEPVHGRCIFVRGFSDMSAICHQITSNVQAIELLFGDEDKRMAFAEMATAEGADRMVSPGGAHDFGLPWDGMKVLSRMVRWVTLR